MSLVWTRLFANNPNLFFVQYRFITSEPHMAGSKRQKDLAVDLTEKWRMYGFDMVEMPEYKVPLSLF